MPVYRLQLSFWGVGKVVVKSTARAVVVSSHTLQHFPPIKNPSTSTLTNGDPECQHHILNTWQEKTEGNDVEEKKRIKKSWNGCVLSKTT